MTNQHEPEVQWICSLSNGETLQEGKGDFERIEGELSPWLKLQEYIEENDLEITSMALAVNGNRWNLPSAGKNPQFREMNEIETPNSFDFYRKMGRSLDDNKPDEHFNVISANYDDYSVEVWVRDKEPFPSWSIVR